MSKNKGSWIVVIIIIAVGLFFLYKPLEERTKVNFDEMSRAEQQNFLINANSGLNQPSLFSAWGKKRNCESYSDGMHQITSTSQNINCQGLLQFYNSNYKPTKEWGRYRDEIKNPSSSNWRVDYNIRNSDVGGWYECYECSYPPCERDSHCRDFGYEECNKYYGSCSKGEGECNKDSDCCDSSECGKDGLDDDEEWTGTRKCSESKNSILGEYLEWDCKAGKCKSDTDWDIWESCQSGYVCDNQKCKKSSDFCNDDDGTDIYKKGTVYDNSGSYKDYCKDNNYVYEYSCKNVKHYKTSYNCEFGCSDGKCKQEEEKCYDSDGGKNIFNKGYVLDKWGKHYDSCSDDKNIREYYCVGQMAATCPSGYICSDGACIISREEPNIVEYKSPRISIQGNNVFGYFYLENKGGDMEKNYLLEMQVVPSGHGAYVAYGNEHYSTPGGSTKTCNPDYRWNVHDTFKLDEDGKIIVNVLARNVDAGTYDVYAVLVDKCWTSSGNTAYPPYERGKLIKTITIKRECNTEADIDCDGIISNVEFDKSVKSWKEGNISNINFDKIIGAWKK